MVQLPELVQDAPLTRFSNSVLVGTMKFTLDQFDAFFGAQNPAPARLSAQLTFFRSSYNNVNSAYALTRESLLTSDISSLDKEGDQLYLAVKETSEAAQRMTYVQARKQAGDRNMVFLKKYKIDTKENFISEWSKMQQLCEEASLSAQITADMATLGLTEVMARLTDIANQLRDLLTQRSNELPAQQAMKQAREAIYPEYRALIDILNGFALVDENISRFATLIQTLNRNIDYVRIHAISNGGSTNGGGDNGGDNGNGNGNNDNGGDDNGGGDTPTPNPNPDPNPDPNSGGGDNGGGGDDNHSDED